MKKIRFLVISMLALNSIIYAGGDVKLVVEDTAISMDDDSLFYIGLGFGKSFVKDDFTDEVISDYTVMLQLGYQYNQYVAAEGRYLFGFNTNYDPGNTKNLSGTYDGDFSSWGLYVKPIYPIGDFSIYALLGYGGVTQSKLMGDDAYESGFQWGLGANYFFIENISVFVDYVRLYDDTGFDYRAQDDDIISDVWTFGISYKF